MKLRTIFLIAVLASVLGVRAQKLTVEKMAAAPMDLSASQYERKDLNGKPCALVKVQLATTGAQFEGNVLPPVEYKTGEYWVYMSEGSYMLSVKHPSYVPLSVNFRDYKISGVVGKATYILTLLMPQVSGGNVDDGMRYLAMTVEPATATVYIDDQPQMLQNGTLSMLLPMGQHNYRVESPPAYETKSGTFTIGEETLQLPVKLESLMASLGVTATTAGTQIYVNDQLRGTSSWTGSLAAGTYRIEGRLNGHHSHRQTVTLSQRDNKQLTIPALEAIVGNLNVNYQPMNAEVWLDGKKTGTSPNVFRNIQVGSHEVEIRANGHQPKKETVTIEEGKTAMLTGALEAQSQPTAANNSDASAGETETFSVNGVSFNMVRVDGGSFQMGSDDSEAFSDEKPVHKVTLYSYYIGETEVTQELWKAVMGKNPSNFKGAKRPVECVSWEDCQEFIDKLNEKTGRRFRLPTEAEWEYAARGGKLSKNYKYSGSNSIGEVAWMWANSGDNRLSGDWSYDKLTENNCRTHDVKTKQSNELGLYDMSGNVYEWCQDWYSMDYYSSSPQENPTGPSSGSHRVFRGGSWYIVARLCRSSLRYYYTPSFRSYYLGLRLAL